MSVRNAYMTGQETNRRNRGRPIQTGISQQSVSNAQLVGVQTQMDDLLDRMRIMESQNNLMSSQMRNTAPG